MSDLRVNRVRSLSGGTVEFVDGVSGDADGLRFDPKIIAYNPVALTTDLNVATTQFSFTFDQPIEFSGIGTIQIRKSSDNSVYQSFTCGVSAGATIAGSVLQLNTSAGNFDFFTNYIVSLPSVGIANTYGQYYKGSDAYTFRTGVSVFDVQGGDFSQIIVSPTSPTGFYKYNIFTSSGIATFTGPSASATDFAYVLVAGGGAGGHENNTYQGGGGGGAGGFIKNYNSSNLPAGTYSVSIGAGGQASFDNPGGTNSPHPPTGGPGSGTWPQQASNGSNSSFGPTPVGTIIAYGGGKAGQAQYGIPYPSYTYSYNSPNYHGSPGGSGGGGTVNGTSSYPTSGSTRRHPGGTGRSYPSPNQQGYPGGDAGTNPNYTGTQPGGGGGGAGGSGTSQSYYTGTPTRQYQNSGGQGGSGLGNPEFPGPGMGLIPGFPNDLASAMGTSGYLAGGGGSGIYTYPTQYRYAPPPSSFEPWTPPAPGGNGGGGDGYFYAGPPPGPNQPNPYYSGSVRYASAGIQNTGGGGGGGSTPGGPTGQIPTPAPGNFYGAPGGSGVMMIRYAHPGS